MYIPNTQMSEIKTQENKREAYQRQETTYKTCEHERAPGRTRSGKQRNSHSDEVLVAEALGTHPNLLGLFLVYAPWSGACQQRFLFA